MGYQGAVGQSLTIGGGMGGSGVGGVQGRKCGKKINYTVRTTRKALEERKVKGVVSRVFFWGGEAQGETGEGEEVPRGKEKKWWGQKRS